MINTPTLITVKQILFRYLNPKDYSLFIFGSWVSGKNRKYSDIDIGFKGRKNVSLSTIALLQEAFEESTLPYTVDLVDFSKVSERFRTVAEKDRIMLN